jgi:transmembrane sensor
MAERRIYHLMQRHLAQQCNAAEQEELALLIASLRDEELKAELLLLWNNYDTQKTLPGDRSQKILSAILSAQRPEEKILPKKRKVLFYARLITAAAATILIFAGIYLKYVRSSPEPPAMVAKRITPPPQKETSYVRNISLPDGSTVILHSGSTILIPKTFTGNIREITLNGEAYFDITPNKDKPFIIHTGKIKTTVLGTAFNIKAWPGEKNITVSVTRGKVKVENDKKVLAVLTADQQVKYCIADAGANQQKVKANEIVTDWTKQDMMFDGMPLESIAEVLSKRYGVNITIANPQLAKTLIVSSFSGTESLLNILDILCTINANTKYTINDDEITIAYK